MRFVRRRLSALDSDGANEPPQRRNHAVEAAHAMALAEETDAAQDRAAAARAKIRALQRRQQAAASDDTVSGGDAAEPASQDAELDTDVTLTTSIETPQSIRAKPQSATDAVPAEPVTEKQRHAVEVPRNMPQSPNRWRARGLLKPAGTTLAILCTLTLLAASGYMLWQQRLTAKHQQQETDYEAAAKRDVVTLMSLDFNKVNDDFQHIIENTTGKFRDEFKAQATNFIAVAKDSKVVADVDVHMAAVESMAGDSAVVLVAAVSHVTNSSGAKEEPRPWRLSVSLQREDGRIKMSKVEFVP